MARRSVAPTLAFSLVAMLAFAACGGPAAAPANPGPARSAATADADDAAYGPGADPSAGAGPATDGQTGGDTGGDTAGDLTPGTSLDACGIVTPAEVATIAKTATVAPGVLHARPTTLSPGQTECTYRGDFGQIIVELTPEDGANLYDAARGAYPDASDISGRWDGAFNSAQDNRAFVWKGRVTAMFTLFLTDLDQLPVATDLAKQVVAKLP